MMHRDKLRVQVDYLEANKEIAAVGCGGVLLSKNYKPTQTSSIYDISKSDIYHYGESLPLLLASLMVRANKAKDISYNHKLDVGEDFDYFSRYLDGARYASIASPYYYYLTGTYTAKKIFVYQVKQLRTFGEVVHNGAVMQGLKGLASVFFKVIIYSIILPILGVEKTMRLRGHGSTISENQIREFEEQFAAYNMI